MRHHTGFPPPLLAVALLLSGGAGHSQAASVFAGAYAGEGNQQFGRVLGTYDSTSAPFVPVSGEGGSTHDLEPAGGAGELDFEGSATASASYFALRAGASGSVSNAFLDENYDHEAETGVPTAYFSQGTARFSQTLMYGGTAHSYTSTYIMRLTGTVSGTGRAAVSINLTHGSELPQNWFFDVNGSYDLLIYSQAYVHGAFAQEFTLSINTLYSFDMDFLPVGGTYSGSADFGSTLEVVGIDLRDENGILQPQGSIDSDSGQEFAVIAAPEPSSAFLIAAGLFAAGQRRRRDGRRATGLR